MPHIFLAVGVIFSETADPTEVEILGPYDTEEKARAVVAWCKKDDLRGWCNWCVQELDESDAPEPPF